MPLSQEAFARGTQNIGAHFVEFDQSQLENRAYMARGVCRSLSIVWIRNQKLRSQNQPRPAWEGPNGQMEEVSWLAEQQHAGKTLEMTEAFLRSFGLRPNGMTFFPQQFDNAKFWFFLKALPGYYLVGRDDPGLGPGHEVAIRTDGNIKLFDPNYGEVTFADVDDLQTFFTQYWPRAYPELANGGGSIFRYV
ncbi:YopT-type cysteine protease domain-containing protein [Pseudomonas sp. HS6]|uniref:YopT-type cysteine protease domain-containing protein n=1 Tax=Pseudomonas sp. HS6 TaxID=2850559 RepID=UPI002019E662|nr:YopT-type cysteine protease domain-containing protein [Pseudomonas sp. HS6]UQS14835.1 hypothetical protein JJN09_27080 [Pseudomonas sp. HS6]